MNVGIDGIGAWGPGFTSWPQLQDLLAGKRREALPAMTAPKPELIPARELRRSPPLVRLAVEVASQACKNANIDPSLPACVFASGSGDMGITDYMCRTMASENGMLSPTKFHNSVHNAAAGYWSISTGCHEPANSVSAFRLTAPIALLEAGTQCALEKRPVLLVAFDEPGPVALDDVCPISAPCGIALLLGPTATRHAIELTIRSAAGEWPVITTPCLSALYETNPAARLLAVLAHLRDVNADPLALPLGEGTSLLVAAGVKRSAA